MSDVGVVINLDDQQVQDSKAVLDYTSRDFAAIRTQLVGLAKGLMPEWETAGEAPDMGTLILELFAYMGDVLHFYIDRTASEAFLGTAVRRSSILYIADMLGYTPVGQQAASVELNFSLQANDVNDPDAIKTITIPKGTRVYNSSGDADEVVIFEMSHQVVVNPGDTAIVSYADEGVSVDGESMGSSQGIPNTEFVIQNKGVIYGTVRVHSQEGGNNIEWSFVTHLANARPTQAVFTTFTDESGFTHVVFGDNAAGRIPPVNALMFVGYRYGVGARANNLGAGAIDTIAPIANVDQFGLTVTNPKSPIGGSDPESIDSMRYSISRGGSRIKNRAVTLNDFADLAMQVPGVVKSVAYGTVYTAVHVRIAPPDGKANIDYMTRLCSAVESYLYDKILVGSSVYVEPTDVDTLWHDVYMRVIVHVQDAFNRTNVRTQVESVLRSLMKFTNVDFGTRISMGLVYRATLAVQGVEWAELTWLSPNEPPLGLIQSSDLVLFGAMFEADTVYTIADPGTGQFRTNSAATPTIIAFSKTTGGGTNVATDLLALKPGDQILMRPLTPGGTWRLFVVTGAVTDSGSWVQFPVSMSQQSSTPPTLANNDDVLFDFKRPAVQEVFDVETPELLIPRIEPTEVTESEVDFPDFTEEERTHDGLWVRAYGGVVNT